MYLFRYRIWFDTDRSDNLVEVERTFRADSEGEAFRQVEAKYPTWTDVELVHQLRVGQ